MTRALFALATVAAACLCAATPSLAATPVVVGQAQGGTPDIAVDPLGALTSCGTTRLRPFPPRTP